MAVTRVLVGVDGSEDGRRALAWAAALAGAVDAEVVAVHALGLLEQFTPEDDTQPGASHRDEVVRLFETEWCAPLDAVDDVRSRRLVEDGPPAMVLLRLVEREEVDLVVVGSRGVGGFDELLLGSTSAQLVQHSPVPVTAIPHRR